MSDQDDARRDNLHRCACCTKPIKPGLLMCWRHWQQVPRLQQQEVLATWRDYERAGPKWSWRARTNYERARGAAIAVVDAKTNHPANEGATSS